MRIETSNKFSHFGYLDILPTNGYKTQSTHTKIENSEMQCRKGHTLLDDLTNPKVWKAPANRVLK